MKIEEFARHWVPIIGLVATAALWFNTNRQINVMQDTLQQNKATLQHDQRPWVGLKELQNPFIQPGVPIQVTAILLNSGKSVALNTKADLAIVRDPSRRQLDQIVGAAQATMSEITHSTSTVFPGSISSITASTKEAVDEKEIRQIKEKAILVYLVGSISYRDVFEQSHTTSFCLRYEPRGNGFDHCEKYNTAD